MAATYKILPDLNLIILTHEQQLEDRDCAATFDSIMSEEQFQADMNLLVDVSNCSFENKTYATMQRLSRNLGGWYAARSETARTAIVSTGEIGFGMSRMYQMIADSKGAAQIDVFRSVGDALTFLGLKGRPDDVATWTPHSLR